MATLMDRASQARDLTLTTLILGAPLANLVRVHTLPVMMEMTGPVVPVEEDLLANQAKVHMEEAPLANRAKAHTLPVMMEMTWQATTNGLATTIPAL
jgi:hypothetical protein